MNPLDCSLLYRWIQRHQSEAESLWCSVALCGEPTLPPHLAASPLANVAASAWPLRCDAVLRSRGFWRIIECKPRLSHAAIGQILVYLHHWRVRFPDLPLSKPLIICDEAIPELIDPARSLGIGVALLTEA